MRSISVSIRMGVCRGEGLEPGAVLSDGLGSNFRCVLKVWPIGFVDGLEVGHERKTGV